MFCHKHRMLTDNLNSCGDFFCAICQRPFCWVDKDADEKMDGICDHCTYGCHYIRFRDWLWDFWNRFLLRRKAGDDVLGLWEWLRYFAEWVRDTKAGLKNR